MESKNTQIISPIFSWIFGVVVVTIGLVNVVHGEDIGFGVFILLLSLVYFLPVSTLLKDKINSKILVTGKIILGFLIVWAAVGVGELFDKIDLLTR